MVKRSSAPAECEFRKPQSGGNPHVVGAHPCPYRIESSKPVEQTGVLGAGNDSGQRLIKMMVGVDQTRDNNVIRKVNDLVGCLRNLRGGANLFDPAIACINGRVFEVCTVHRRQRPYVLYQKRCHRKPS